MAEKLSRYRGEREIGKIKDMVEEITHSDSLIELTKELYKEQVYANTPEVIAFAKELQELRRELLKAK